MVAQTMSIFILPTSVLMRKPMPTMGVPKNSATIAPIKAKVELILRPLKMKGKAEGKSVGGNGQVNVKFDHPGGSYGGVDVNIDGEVIWGFDATGMAIEYLADPGRFASGELGRVAALPIGTERPR